MRVCASLHSLIPAILPLKQPNPTKKFCYRGEPNKRTSLLNARLTSNRMGEQNGGAESRPEEGKEIQVDDGKAKREVVEQSNGKKEV